MDVTAVCFSIEICQEKFFDPFQARFPADGPSNQLQENVCYSSLCNRLKKRTMCCPMHGKLMKRGDISNVKQ